MFYVNTLYITIILLNILFAVFIVFSQRRNPAVSWAWLVVIALIPVAGFVLYLLVGQDSRKYREFVQEQVLLIWVVVVEWLPFNL